MRPETCLTFSLVCVEDEGTVLTYSENSFCEAQHPKISRVASNSLLQLALSPASLVFQSKGLRRARAPHAAEAACGTWYGCRAHVLSWITLPLTGSDFFNIRRFLVFLFPSCSPIELLSLPRSPKLCHLLPSGSGFWQLGHIILHRNLSLVSCVQPHPHGK